MTVYIDRKYIHRSALLTVYIDRKYMKLVGPQVFFDEELRFLRYLPIDNVESDDRIWLQLLQGLTLCRVQSFVSYFQN